MNADIIRQQRELALASRLKRLHERLAREASQVYRDLDEDFEARWFSVFYTLGRKAPLSVVEIARELHITHTAVNQVAGELLRKGLVTQERDRTDARRRILRLSGTGQALFRRLKPVWNAVVEVNREWLNEAGVDLLDALDRAEDALDERSLYDRLRVKLDLPGPEITIEEYRPAYKKHFRALNEEWLSEHFTIEPSDAKILEDPNRHIIRRNGAIFFALAGEDVVGCCALRRHRDDLLELAEMAVTAEFRRRGIGRRLAESVIARAREWGAERLWLQTSPVLVEAIALYHDLGFRQVGEGPFPADRYRRPTITMVLELSI